MKAIILTSPPEDARTEWRRLNDLIKDVEKITTGGVSSHPQLITFSFTEDGPVLNCTGLVNALAAKGINVTQV